MCGQIYPVLQHLIQQKYLHWAGVASKMLRDPFKQASPAWVQTQPAARPRTLLVSETKGRCSSHYWRRDLHRLGMLGAHNTLKWVNSPEAFTKRWYTSLCTKATTKVEARPAPWNTIPISLKNSPSSHWEQTARAKGSKSKLKWEKMCMRNNWTAGSSCDPEDLQSDAFRSRMSFYCCCCFVQPFLCPDICCCVPKVSQALLLPACTMCLLPWLEVPVVLHTLPAGWGWARSQAGAQPREQADLTRHIKPTRAGVLSLECVQHSENCAFVSWHQGALYLLWLMRGKDGLCSLPDPAACLGLGNPVWLMHQYQ